MCARRILARASACRTAAGLLDGCGLKPHNVPQMSAELTPARSSRNRRASNSLERAASEEHFLDLCRLLGQPTPAETDATGEEQTFENGVAVTDAASAGSRGDRGFADVWWPGKFAWEYKRKSKHKTLTEAYRQLSQYRKAL